MGSLLRHSVRILEIVAEHMWGIQPDTPLSSCPDSGFVCSGDVKVGLINRQISHLYSY